MIGTLQQVYEDMEHGVYDLTKGVKCSCYGRCDQPPIKIKENKELFWRTRKLCDMRETFFGEKL